MIHFRPITLADRALVERYTLTGAQQNCDLAFANIYCWRNHYRSEVAEVEGALVIRFHIDGSEQIGYMQPLGVADWPSLLTVLEADAAQWGQPLRLVGLDAATRDQLQALFPDRFAFDRSRAMADYIYRREDLCLLRGKDYQPKRNHINRFRATYPDACYEPLTTAHFDECRQLEQAWCQQHNGCRESSMQAERTAMQEAFANFEALGLQGGCLRIDGHIAAFTYGSAVNEKTFVIHVEKADTRYEGVFAMINRSFAETLNSRFEWINREEDLGVMGLRKAKLSYYPAHLWEKYTAISLTDEARACRHLWEEAFPTDDRTFIDRFLARYFKQEQLLSISDNGELVAMAHLIPFQSEWGKVGYLYGVATDTRYRRQGLASKLLDEAMQRAQERGYTALMLIPGNDTLRQFYAERGFEGAVPLQFILPDRFDFGTGQAEEDVAMWRFCGEQKPTPETLHCHYEK